MKSFLKKFNDFSVPASCIAFMPGRGDYLMAALAGIAFFALAFVWPYPLVHPNLWSEVAVAAGTRPPECVPGGLWRGLVGLLFENAGLESGFWWLGILGKLAGAVTVACAYFVLRSILPQYLEIQLRSYIRRRWLVRCLIGLCAFLFCCSDPVWRIFQHFGPEALVVLLSFVALAFFYRFLQNGFRVALILAYLLTGVLAAESPVGFVLVAFLTVGLIRAQNLDLVDDNHVLFNVMALQRLKWQLSFCWLFGFAATLSYDFYAFLQADGLAATGLETSAFVVSFFTTWWKGVVGAASPIGWALGVSLAFVPFLLSLLLMRRATCTDKFLPYEIAGFFFVSGTFALLQLCGFSRAWFWTWVSFPPMLPSGVLATAFMFMCTISGMFALAVAGVDFWCRDYRHVAVRLYNDPMLEQSEDDRISLSVRVIRTVRLGLLAVVLMSLLGFTVWGRHQVTTRRLLGLVDEFLTETVRECAAAHWLFTDGVFDPLLEVRSVALGHPISPVSMMASKGAYDAYLRTRTARDKEDRAVFETSVLSAFRLWAEKKPMRMKETAFQLGFENWRRREKETPTCLGVVATGAEVPADEVKRARDVAHALAGRTLGLYADAGAGQKLDCPDGEIVRVFESVQWRLARLAQHRAAEHDRANEMPLAAAEKKLADRLDDENVSFREIQKKVEGLQRKTNPVLTPREGLGIALRRHDFIMARRYALPILNGDPDDPHANYAMGMSHFVEERWGQAIRFLERVHKKMPNESAVMNNMAVAYWKDNRLEDAVYWAEMALKANPDSAEVKDNLARIRKDYLALKQKQLEQKAKEADIKSN